MNQQQILVGTALAAALFGIADFIYEKHPHVRFEAWFNFYGFFAVLATCGLVVVAVLARNVLEREEDYYDE